jgi:hypothetical protein
MAISEPDRLAIDERARQQDRMRYVRSMAPLGSCDRARHAAVALVVAWMGACGAGTNAPTGAPSITIPPAELAAARGPRMAPSSAAAQALPKEILPGRTVGDTTCQQDADCVVGTPSEGCCPCCPEAPRAASRAWLAWFAEFRPNMCSTQHCGTVCDGVACEKVEYSSAFRAVCVDRSCALVRAR